MFKLKEKTQKEVETKKEEEVEVVTSSKEESIVDGEPAEKFHLAWALGKTKEKMEKDFYIFQIKELMKKMGNALISPVGDLVSIEKLVTRLIKFETHDLLTSPLVAMELANKKSNLFKNLSLTAIVGYPCGENGFKSINTEVKELVKKGVKNIIVTTPLSMEGLSLTGAVKGSLNKVCAKVGKGLGVAIHGDLGEEYIKKSMKSFSSVKAENFTLLCQGIKGSALKNLVKFALSYKGDKKLFVYTGVASLADLSEITELGVDRVYTPSVVKIGDELLEKFDVTLD